MNDEAAEGLLPTDHQHAFTLCSLTVTLAKNISIFFGTDGWRGLQARTKCTLSFFLNLPLNPSVEMAEEGGALICSRYWYGHSLQVTWHTASQNPNGVVCSYCTTIFVVILESWVAWVEEPPSHFQLKFTHAENALIVLKHTGALWSLLWAWFCFKTCHVLPVQNFFVRKMWSAFYSTTVNLCQCPGKFHRLPENTKCHAMFYTPAVYMGVGGLESLMFKS